MSDEEYIDSGYHLAHFADEVWCSCPECGNLAIVRAQPSSAPPWTLEKARIVCRSCPYTQEWSIDAWLGPAIGDAVGLCDSCGSLLEREFRRQKFRHDLPESAVVRCEVCGRESNTKLNWRRPFEATAVDPYFSLPLHLKIGCGRGELWAYNPRHLDELIRFARARIRRRTPIQGLSMIARLPPWVKSAKNRGKVIKCLEALVEKARLDGGAA